MSNAAYSGKKLTGHQSIGEAQAAVHHKDLCLTGVCVPGEYTTGEEADRELPDPTRVFQRLSGNQLIGRDCLRAEF